MLDIEANRRSKKYSKKELLQRCNWAFGGLLFRAIPRPLFELRSWILRFYGGRIGKGVRVSNTAKIQYPWMITIGDYSSVGDHAVIYNLGPLMIGSRVTISQYAHLCGGTHNHQSATMELVRSPISIGNDAWIAADAFLGPGIQVGEGAVLGARAVVMKDVAAWSIVAGNPARVIGQRTIAADSTGI